MRRTALTTSWQFESVRSGDRGIRSDIGARRLFQSMAVRFLDNACEGRGKTQFATPTCMDKLAFRSDRTAGLCLVTPTAIPYVGWPSSRR